MNECTDRCAEKYTSESSKKFAWTVSGDVAITLPISGLVNTPTNIPRILPGNTPRKYTEKFTEKMHSIFIPRIMPKKFQMPSRIREPRASLISLTRSCSLIHQGLPTQLSTELHTIHIRTGAISSGLSSIEPNLPNKMALECSSRTKPLGILVFLYFF